MPLKLVAPRQGRSQNYRVRGTHYGTKIDASAGTADRKVADKERQRIEREIESGRFAAAAGPDFMSAAISYLEAGGEARFVAPLSAHFGALPLGELDQAAIDRAAVALYPNATPATRNRQVYTVVSAILKHAGVEKALRRPKGARGRRRPHFLAPDQANALIAAAEGGQPRFGALLTFLFGTGCRLSEALRLRWDDVDLSRSTAIIRETKNGRPRVAHLPPVVVAALANVQGNLAGSVFRMTKCGRIYAWLDEAATAAGVVIPDGVAFHICRHFYGAAMRRYAGLDTSGLVATGAWDSHEGARVYEHVDASEEARKADLLPIGKGRVG
jgi:integrase